MFVKFKLLACKIGRHDLFMVRQLSDQAALVECSVCSKRWAAKMEGDNQGAMLPWNKETQDFYAMIERDHGPYRQAS